MGGSALCCCCSDRERDFENDLLCCPRCAGRIRGGLGRIPELVDELHGLGFVERDTGDRPAADGGPGGRGWDPVANVFPAGPLNGSTSAPRVSGSPGRSTPIRIDPTDLLARPRNGSLAVAARSPWPEDQVGHLPVASVLDFWVRDWADLRGERPPDLRTRERSPVGVLSGWLSDRLDWALGAHPALDEFARDVGELRRTLDGVAGNFEAPPERVDRPCPACGWWALAHDRGSELIRCGNCGRALTADEYRDHLEDVIKTNWRRAGEHPAPLRAPVWVRDDAAGRVALALTDGAVWRSWDGVLLAEVSYWAPVVEPPDPGPAKDEPG